VDFDLDELVLRFLVCSFFFPVCFPPGPAMLPDDAPCSVFVSAVSLNLEDISDAVADASAEQLPEYI